MTKPADELRIELAALAAHLRSRRAAILEAWSRAAQRDPDVTTSSALSRVQFYDHIPRLLDALEDRLAADGLSDAIGAKQEEVESAERHGLQRWQQGYDNEEVMREWIALNACLADEMQTFAQARPTLAPAILSEGWRRVSELTVTGMSESVAQYARLQQAEAAGRVQSLEGALRQLEEVDRERATAWREAAHDLRGNLSVVQNVAAVLQQGGSSEKFLRMLGGSVAALHSLLDDLTTQARLDAGQEKRTVRPFDAAKALGQLADGMQLAAKDRGLYLVTEGADSLAVEGDEIKVCRIAQNLLQNALKYTRSGGVTLGWEPAGDGTERWTMRVRDTGPGLPADASAPLASAIQSATRDGAVTQPTRMPPQPAADERAAAPPSASRRDARELAAGEGVGLSIVKRLCELLDAQLEARSVPGRGTTFHVTFPNRYLKG